MSGEQKPFQWQKRTVRDQQLLARMKEDFDAGFSNVVEDYWRELCIRAYRMLEGSDLVYLSEDAVQEGLISAYKNLRHHRQKLDTLHLQHWLYAIVRLVRLSQSFSRACQMHSEQLWCSNTFLQPISSPKRSLISK
jgi:DNA-directed RNA polymerase specialized sigma24 family protein